MPDFTLWLEFETADFTSRFDVGTGRLEKTGWNNKNDFCNIGVTLADGRRYGITVWTFDFLATTVAHDRANGENLGGAYQLPPDLFVRELTRDCLESIIADLLKRGSLEKLLNPSITVLADDGDA